MELFSNLFFETFFSIDPNAERPAVIEIVELQAVLLTPDFSLGLLSLNELSIVPKLCKIRSVPPYWVGVDGVEKSTILSSTGKLFPIFSVALKTLFFSVLFIFIDYETPFKNFKEPL